MAFGYTFSISRGRVLAARHASQKLRASNLFLNKELRDAFDRRRREGGYHSAAPFGPEESPRAARTGVPDG